MDNEYIKPKYCHSNGSVYEREDVELAVLQTTAGEMGIMSGHIPTVAALKLAMLKLTFIMVTNM